MNIMTNIKDNLIILSFTLYIFFWSFNIYENIHFRYIILFPFLISFFDKKKKYKINLKYFYLIPILLVIHYILVNLFNSNSFNFRDFASIIFLSIIIYSFLVYRDLIIEQFTNILKLFFFTLFIFSLMIPKSIDVGSCSSSFYSLFPLLKNIPFSKGYFLENSHLAMMNVGAIIASIYIYLKKKDIVLLALLILSLIINILNISTTFILGYVICSVIFIFITHHKLFRLFLISSSLFFLFFIYQSHDCNKKYSYLNLEDIKNERINRDKSGELTANIYERSFVISMRTLKNNPFGWGYDGTIKATINYLDYRENKKFDNEDLVWKLNLRDALGNIFKITIEFGYFTFILLFLFFNYLRKIKITAFEIFVISIFVVQLFRGSGYINGGFILIFSEIFLIKLLIINNPRLKKKSPNLF